MGRGGGEEDGQAEKSTPDCPPSGAANTGSCPVPPPTGLDVYSKHCSHET